MRACCLRGRVACIGCTIRNAPLIKSDLIFSLAHHLSLALVKIVEKGEPQCDLVHTISPGTPSNNYSTCEAMMPSRDPQRSAEEGLSSDLFGLSSGDAGEGLARSLKIFSPRLSLLDKPLGLPDLYLLRCSTRNNNAKIV